MLLLNTKLKFEAGMSDFHQVIIIIFKVKTDKDENGKLVRDEKELANIFNDFFVNTVPNL